MVSRDNLGTLFVYRDVYSKDWWHAYTISIDGLASFRLRPGDANYIEITTGLHTLRAASGRDEVELQLDIQRDESSFLRLSGNSKRSWSYERAIRFDGPYRDLSELHIKSFREQGYSPLKMVVGYAGLVAIVIGFTAFILAAVVHAGTHAYFLLLALAFPAYFADVLVRSIAGVRRLHKTEILLGSKYVPIDTQSDNLEKPERYRILQVMMILIGIILAILGSFVIRSVLIYLPIAFVVILGLIASLEHKWRRSTRP